MTTILISAILFGFVHPGSKIIMNTGISLLSFCILYIGIRLLFQIPMVLRSRAYRISPKYVHIFLIFGLAGALLQTTEFFGISRGLPVPLVTFLVYSHPIWTLLLSSIVNREAIGGSSMIKIVVATMGLTLIAGSGLVLQSYDWKAYIGPLAAGLMIAIWITISGFLSKSGSSIRTISFYYDLFSFMALVLFSIQQNGDKSLAEAGRYLLNPLHLTAITFYSLAIGYLPNLLFYMGSKYVSAFSAGLLLLLEPLVSTLTSHILWHDKLSIYFIFGAMCVLLVNCPVPNLNQIKSFSLNIKFMRKLALGPLASASFLVFFLSSHGNAAHPIERVLYVLQTVPDDPSDYVVTQELKEIEIATNEAVNEYRKNNKFCHFGVIKELKRGSMDDLFLSIKSISERPERAIAIGFSRSNFARVAAKAASGSTLKGISIAASTDQLHAINPNFMSVGSPWQKQWMSLKRGMKIAGCTPANSTLIYDPLSHLSKIFGESYSSEKIGKVISNAATSFNLDALIRDGVQKCLFIPVNFSEAEPYLQKLIKSDWSGTVFGVDDWDICKKELRALFKKNTKNSFELVIPSEWNKDLNTKSNKFYKKMASLLGDVPSPISAFTHDSVIIALDYLCSQEKEIVFPLASSIPLLRNYEGLGVGGNFMSEFVLTNPIKIY